MWPVRLAMTKPPKTAAPSGGGLIAVAFFYGRPSAARLRLAALSNDQLAGCFSGYSALRRPRTPGLSVI